MAALAKHEALTSQLMAQTFAGAALSLPFSKEVPCLDCHVAGTMHSDAATVEAELVPGAVLVLRREPDNEADPLAVRCLTPAGVHVGWIPRRKNEVVSRLLDAGKLFVAKVTSAGREGDWLEVKVTVCLREG
jgi:hypothetical protein